MTELQFRKVLQEAMDDVYSWIPDPEDLDYDYTFSPEFDAKMEQMLRENGIDIKLKPLSTGRADVYKRQPPALCDLLGEAPMKLRDKETLFDIQIDEEKGDATLLTSMARSLGVDFRFADNQKLSLKNKTVDTFRILADRVDAAAITKYLDMRSITYKRFPEVI